MFESAPPIRSLADLYARFAALSVDEPPVRHVRGVALAVALDWWDRIPAGPAKEMAFDRLDDAVEQAVKALYPADACS